MPPRGGHELVAIIGGMAGTLILCATPIGNLVRRHPRGSLRPLSGADVIFAEDTRRTGQLLKHLGISASHAELLRRERTEPPR